MWLGILPFLLLRSRFLFFFVVFCLVSPIFASDPSIETEPASASSDPETVPHQPHAHAHAHAAAASISYHAADASIPHLKVGVGIPSEVPAPAAVGTESESESISISISTSTSTLEPTPAAESSIETTPTPAITITHRHTHHQIQTEHNEKEHHRGRGKRELESENDLQPTLSPRELKELFVTGHNGTTLSELSIVAIMAPASYLFRYVLVVVGFTVAGIPYPMQRSMEHGGSNVPLHLTNNYGHIHGHGHGRAGPAPTTAAAVAAAVTASAAYRYGHFHAALGWIIDFFTIIVPLFLSMTHVHLLPIILTGMLIISLMLLGVYYSVYGHVSGVLSTGSSDQMVALNGTRAVFVGDYRSSLMITTAIAILAVDFPLFPRRFAKTETFGQSLMDIGVGCFLFAHALVSSRRPSLHHSHVTSSSVFKLSPIPHQRAQRMRKLLRSVMPLLILGVLRLVTHKAADYQVHVNEYGVHWNFFFTLAAVSLLSELLSWFIHPSSFASAGCIIVIIYQFLLSHYGWTEYLLNAPRDNIIAANKEGLASSIGYLSLYLMAVQFGSYILPTARINQWHKRLVVLFLSDALLWILTSWLDTHVQPISRRMVNLSYVCWMLAFNIGLLSLFLTLSLISTRASTFQSYIQLSISRNALPFFMLSNILTGAVNKSMDTLAANDTTANYVLLAYMAVCTGVMCLCHYRRINLKFW